MSESRKKRLIDLCWLWIYGLCILLALWIILSTFEVWIHNTEIEYTYSVLNFWKILSGR